ncbi:MAG: hypothetical protein KAI47_21365 [Deltaproteobacteria bacterium]|nr:hypothetical protein [Deltaproteobacteria bacterium]
MTHSISFGAFMTLLVIAGCDNGREWRSRQAVRHLIEASPLRVSSALDKVTKIGCYALIDIEQAFHSAPLPGRLRLLDALARGRCAEAIPLLKFIERWDNDDDVRARAHAIRQALERRKH